MDEQSTKTREDEPGERDPRDRHELVGKTIDGRIAIEGVVGEGGMGIVYLGHQTNVDRKVAIKVLLPERCDEETVQRFQNEAKAASRLSHPNTITIHDFGNWGDLLFIVMEFLEGQSFQDVVDNETPIHAMRVAKIASQVLASLQEAHITGIIHRDIKPDNVFLKTVGGQTDFVKVLDFGVAKLGEQLRGGDATLTKAGMIFGTPKYMSPEQATARDLDPRSDLYSVGVMMYEALAGRAPFTATDPVSILIQHVHDETPPFAEVAPNVQIPIELQQIVLHAMQKKPEQRFESALQMKQAIDHAMLSMQASLSTVQGAAVSPAYASGHGPPSGAIGAHPSGASQPAPTYPPAAPPSTHPPTAPSGSGQTGGSGTWSDALGVGQSGSGPSVGLGAPVDPPVVTTGGGSKGLVVAVLIVGILLIGALGYLFVIRGDDPETTDAGGNVVTTDAGEEAPDAGEVSDVAEVLDAVAVADVPSVETPDAAETPDATETPDAVAVADVPPVETPDVTETPDAVVTADVPPVETPDADETPDAVAVVERELVRVRFDVEPDGARIRVRGQDYERDGRYYVFDLADGDSFRANVSADHHEDERVSVDLDDADDDGTLTVRVRLDLDPCDPANGPVDPYVCN